MLSTIIDAPILDALCNRVGRRAASIWWYLFINWSHLPIEKKQIQEVLKLNKDVLSRALRELEMYNLVYVTQNNKRVYLYADNAQAHGKPDWEGYGVAPLGRIRVMDDMKNVSER